MVLGTDRRRHPRESIAVLVTYADAQSLTSSYTDNLSTHGMFLFTRRRFRVGARLRFILSFPGLLASLQLAGVVRWRKEGDAGESGVGLEFDALEPQAQGLLDAFLAEVRRIPEE